jgi:hypothetical protein
MTGNNNPVITVTKPLIAGKNVRHYWNSLLSGNGAQRAFSEVILQHSTHELRDPDEVSNSRGPELHATDEPTPTVSATHRPQEDKGKEAHRNR